MKERFPLLRHRAVARCGIWIILALVAGGALTTLVRAELSEEEKKKRAAFLNAREEMRTLPSPNTS